MTTLHAKQLPKSSSTTGQVKRRVVGSLQDAKAKLLAQQLGSFVVVLCNSRGISVNTLCTAIGVTKGTATRWTKYGYPMSLAHIVKVSRYFFMSPWTFMEKAVQHWKENDYAP